MMTTTSKHSFYLPTVPASAPTTPAYIRSNKFNDDGPPPVTPQRIPRAHRHQHQLQNYFSHSPSTPASTLSTPYTPLSFRSAWSSDDSSALTTPVSVASAKRMGISLSPNVHITGYRNETGRADSPEDWRSRANENGIRVTSGENAHFVNDEGTYRCGLVRRDPAHISPFRCIYAAKSVPLMHALTCLLDPLFTVQSHCLALVLHHIDALLPPPFFTGPRRPRSQTLAHQGLPSVSAQMQAQPHTPGRRTLAALNTPPPLASNVNRIKMKGSFTDPAYPRRRQPFGQTPTELFDIDENDPYPMTFSPSQRLALPLALHDPFDGSGLSDLSFPRIPAPVFFPHNECSETPSKTGDSSCSVCGQTSSSLAVLDPCSHVLCSACLTSALNIVGEKDMECAVCKIGVADFHLRTSGMNGSTGSNGTRVPQTNGFKVTDVDGLLGQFNIFDIAETSTTINAGQRQASGRPGELPVLRIDNVPWDITPPAIASWLKHPVRRVHVLLDRKGKTLSHAFVEMVDEEAARLALRTAQNSVLGKGKRARGVTVTRSGQEELMKALFPSWQGRFDGTRPSLGGLNNEQVLATLEYGLISDSELKALLHLIQSPDVGVVLYVHCNQPHCSTACTFPSKQSHFLKVPSLPFHSLISILSKFPVDQDSRVFWSSTSRDTLYEITMTALQILVLRNTDKFNWSDPELLAQLFQTAVSCQAFTVEQTAKLTNLANTSQHIIFPRSPASSISGLSSHTPDPASQRHTNVPRAPVQAQHSQGLQHGPFDGLAREFGLDSHLVEALVHRLSGMH
ncbi:hypothetical protein EW146_g6620 [Bondarzewia mesenterica]|uniref:RING-type domain-containing protein n=1 Tax=Bondarzewia mesenterica TaxID=1095465 RepID=A0A4S4LPW5_9AGAM|nr:hypothetical protein EW146_g6620 [Bondarzewia mesenterica]